MKTIINYNQDILYRKEDLFKCPVILVVNKFTEEAAKEFRVAMSKAHSTSQPVIPIMIDSFGGQVYSLLSMLDTIEAAEKPVVTIATGKAMSCGSVLLAAGTLGYRYAEPNSTIMVHEVASDSRGKIEELKASVKETERLNKLIFTKLIRYCNLKDKNFFSKEITKRKNANWYLTPQAAKKIGLVDKVGFPSLSIDVKLEMELVG